MRHDSSIDVYALTNPAFWALALSQFVKGHEEQSTSAAPALCAYPLLFLPMPLSFSREGLSRFNGTNKRTGLMTWLERNPGVRAIAASEIIAAKPYTRRALTFALAHNLLATTDGWTYTSSSARGWKKPPWPVQSDARGAILQACNRLGQWCGTVDLPTVFISFGVKP